MTSWERRNGGLFLYPHTPMREAVARMAEQETDGPDETPFVVVGDGERPPWAGLSNSCPECGEENLPLLDSVPPMFQFISHCGQSWLRGPITPAAQAVGAVHQEDSTEPRFAKPLPDTAACVSCGRLILYSRDNPYGAWVHQDYKIECSLDEDNPLVTAG